MTKAGAQPILFVENGIGYGGAVICLRHLIRNLDRSRYRPIVVTGRSGEPYQGLKSESEWHPIRDRLIDTPGLRSRIGSLPIPSRLVIVKRMLLQIVARIDDLCNFLPFLLRLFFLAIRRRPVLIHANNEPFCNRAAVLVGQIMRIPVICHVRGEQPNTKLVRKLYSMPDMLVAVSRWVHDSLASLSIPPGRRLYVYDGIELDKLDFGADGGDFRRRFGIPPDAFAVGLVGLLIPWKGQQLFLDAGMKLLGPIQNLFLIMVGGTPDECTDYEQVLRTRASGLEFRDRVIFTGHVSSMDEVYNGLDVVISASTTPEPLGTVVIESLAMGRPLVAPNHGGAAEMVEHNKTGLLFEPGNATSLAEQIFRFREHPDLAKKYGAAARQHALATFSISEHAKNTTHIRTGNFKKNCPVLNRKYRHVRTNRFSLKNKSSHPQPPSWQIASRPYTQG